MESTVEAGSVTWVTLKLKRFHCNWCPLKRGGVEPPYYCSATNRRIGDNIILDHLGRPPEWCTLLNRAVVIMKG
jgi:hypothetical protein